MKKILLVMTILLASISLVTATIKVRPNICYGLALGGRTDEILPMKDIETDVNGVDTKYENIYYNGGSGFGIGVAASYPLMENIEVELGISYIMGGTCEIGKLTDNSTSPVTTATREASSYFLPLDITLKLSTKMDILTPYVGIGPTFPLSAGSTYTYEIVSSGKFEEEGEMDYTTRLGFNACCGVDYELSDSMALNFGLIFRHIILKLNKATITKQTYNGADTLSGLETRNKEIEYKEDSSDDDPTKPGEPKIETTKTAPFSSLSLNVGIVFKF